MDKVIFKSNRGEIKKKIKFSCPLLSKTMWGSSWHFIQFFFLHFAYRLDVSMKMMVRQETGEETGDWPERETVRLVVSLAGHSETGLLHAATKLATGWDIGHCDVSSTHPSLSHCDIGHCDVSSSHLSLSLLSSHCSLAQPLVLLPGSCWLDLADRQLYLGCHQLDLQTPAWSYSAMRLADTPVTCWRSAQWWSDLSSLSPPQSGPAKVWTIESHYTDRRHSWEVGKQYSTHIHLYTHYYTYTYTHYTHYYTYTHT